jgi:cell division protein FtsL
LTRESTITYNNRRKRNSFAEEKKEKKNNKQIMAITFLVSCTIILAIICIYTQGKYSDLKYQSGKYEAKETEIKEQIQASMIQIESLENECYILKKAEQFLCMKIPDNNQVVYIALDDKLDHSYQVADTENGTWAKFFLGLSKNPAYLGKKK